MSGAGGSRRSGPPAAALAAFLAQAAAGTVPAIAWTAREPAQRLSALADAGVELRE